MQNAKSMGKMFILALAATALVGCGGNSTPAASSGTTPAASSTTPAASSTTPSLKKLKIGVGLYSDVGDAPEATKGFLAGIADAVNCEFTYTVLSMMDGSVNVQKAEELISAGCQGLIWTMDMSMDSILEVCQEAGVYLAGYLCDYDTSYDTIKDNPYFLGTVVDGRYVGTAWGGEVADVMIPAGYKNIGMIKFPVWAYPHHAQMDAAFREKVAAYNATAAEADKITLTDTLDLAFAPLESSWLAANPNLDAIYGMCGGISYIYPTLVEANKTNIKLYTAGFDHTDAIMNNSFEKGTKTVQEMVYAPAETITYPVVKLVNKLNGQSFTDEPSVSQRVDSGQVIVTSQTIYDKACQSLYATYNMADSLVTANDVKNLLAAYGGTEAKLVEAVTNMNTAALMAK